MSIRLGSVLIDFLCQLTCQSADLCHHSVASACFFKDTLSIEDEKVFKACKSACLSVC